MKLPIASYSFFNAFQNCPHKAFHIYVARTIPYVETPEMAWGNQVHEAMEKRIKYGAPLPEKMQAAEAAAATFHEYSRAVPVHCEYQLAMTKDGKSCDWKAGGAWFRTKIDCVVLPDPYAWLVDWKTGNVREDPLELACNALVLKVNYPHLESIKGEYFWMKTGQNGLRYTLNDHGATYQQLVTLWAEAETYFRAGEWPKRKNPLCGWCAVTTCEHWKPRKDK